MNTYIYKGPVMEFDRCIADRWQGETRAVSEKKARTNLAFRYKQEHGKTNTAKITLPGKITMIEEEI